MRLPAVAIVSLIFTYLFFIEYLPPLQRVHIPFDLEGYHYPLNDYAFLQLRQHRFPIWDPTVYAGMSFAGNPQVQLFYPPMWLLFLANRHQPWLQYTTLEEFQLAHLWLAFLLCYCWLVYRKLGGLASVLGAGVFAFSGYPLLQLQHLGLICGYAWLPLALLGIDQASDSRSWRPLWKLAMSAAMCFLAGYPPFWCVFAVLTFVYALCHRSIKLAIGAALAIACSLLIAMVQAWPAWEMASMRAPQSNYGLGSLIRPELWAPFLVPNFFDFALSTPVEKNPGGELLYLGVPALFGLILFFRDRNWKGQIPVLGLAAASFVLLTNPFGIVWAVVRHSALLSQICRSYYFLCGIPLAAAVLSATSIDRFLNRRGRKTPRWLTVFGITALTALSIREFHIWLAGGTGFAHGWKGIVDPALMLAAFSVAVFALRSSTGRVRTGIAAVSLIAVSIDYKVFGTSKRLNAAIGNPDSIRRSDPYPGLGDAVYGELKSHPEYRIALDLDAPEPANLRHLGLRTPQGRDPLVSSAMANLLGNLDRAGFGVIDPARHDLLRLLGVRYYITSAAQPNYARLSADSAFREIDSSFYYKVFELIDAQPSYSWEQSEPSGPIHPSEWAPAVREFDVNPASAARFVLAEQFYSGWEASIDGRPAPIVRWRGVFQALDVPPGLHRIRFNYRPRSIRYGATISVVSILLLAFAASRRTGLQRALVA